MKCQYWQSKVFEYDCPDFAVIQWCTKSFGFMFVIYFGLCVMFLGREKKLNCRIELSAYLIPTATWSGGSIFWGSYWACFTWEILYCAGWEREDMVFTQTFFLYILRQLLLGLNQFFPNMSLKFITVVPEILIYGLIMGFFL